MGLFNKKTNSQMGEFLNESVAEAMIPLVKGNTPFVMTDHGRKVYIGMLLDVNKIGGINKRARDNKDVGGVIENISSGKIDAYITQELNDSEMLLFIPTKNTIDMMGDYGRLKQVDGYEFIKMNDKLEIIERTGIYGTYDDFRNIQTGNAKITDFVSESDVIVAGSNEDPMADHSVLTNAIDKAKEVAATVAEKTAPVAEKAAPIIGKAGDAVSKGISGFKSKMAESSGVKDMAKSESKDESKDEEKESDDKTDKSQEETENKKGAKSSSSSKGKATAAAKEKSDEEEIVAADDLDPDDPDSQDAIYTETQVVTSVERIFHADNLDLPLSTEPFDQLFTINNHLIKFDIDPRDTYVNEKLNQIARDANRDLQKLRSDNLTTLRKKYFDLMQMRIMEIQKQLDIKDGTTQYGAYKSLIDSKKSERLKDIAGEIERKKEELKAHYERDMEEYGEAAKRTAISDYKLKFQKTFTSSMDTVESTIKSDIDAEYTAAMSELYTNRRSDALTSLDYNITGVLTELANDYKEMFEKENALYVEWANRMREEAKQLHVEDAKRLAIEEEHNRITTEVNDARAEATAKIEQIKKEYEVAQSALEARTRATIDRAENETLLVKDQMKARTDTLEQDKAELQRRLDEAQDRADKATELVRADYEHRLIQAQDDRDSWKQTLEAYKDQHRHNNRLAAILVVAITIAAIAGGFVAGGVYWNRIVASELSGSQASSEIKIVDPTATTADTVSSIESAVTDAIDNADDTVQTGFNGTNDSSYGYDSSLVDNSYDSETMESSETTVAETTITGFAENTESVVTTYATRATFAANE